MAEKTEHTEVRRPSVDWQLWLWWVLASSFGWGVGAVAGEYAGLAAAGFLPSGDPSAATGQGFTLWAFGRAVGGGAGLGAMQWLIVRKEVSRAVWWIVASIVSGGLVFFAGGSLPLLFGGIVNAAGLGTMLGALQWLVLRRRVPRAAWWVVASGVGGAGMGVVSAVCTSVRWSVQVPDAVVSFVGPAAEGAVVGAVTGVALVWLLRQHGPRQGYRDWIAEAARAKSLEVDFGMRWRLTPLIEFPLWRVSWIEATGELYAVDPMHDRYVVLGHHATRDSVNQAMSGWAEPGPKSLWEWFGVQ